MKENSRDSCYAIVILFWQVEDVTNLIKWLHTESKEIQNIVILERKENINQIKNEIVKTP